MIRRRKGLITGMGATLRAIDIDYAIDHFLVRKQARGLARNSLKAYGHDLADLQACLAGQGITLLGLIAERHVEGWLDDMAGRGHKPRSIARRLAAARGLLAHAVTEGWIQHEPAAAARVRFRATPRTAPEEAAIVRMVDAIAPIGPRALRDRALLSLMYVTAMRVGGVCALDVPGQGAKNVDLERGIVTVADKGGGASVTAMDATTAQRIRDWLAVRDRMAHTDCTALFVAHTGERIGRQGVYQMVRRRGEAVGIEGMGPHLLRHRRVGQVVEALGPYAGREQANHANVATTVSVYGAHVRQVAMQRIQEHCPVQWKGAAA